MGPRNGLDVVRESNCGRLVRSYSLYVIDLATPLPQDPTLSGTNGTRTSEVLAAAILVQLIRKMVSL
jgi:hypothetical protein